MFKHVYFRWKQVNKDYITFQTIICDNSIIFQKEALWLARLVNLTADLRINSNFRHLFLFDKFELFLGVKANHVLQSVKGEPGTRPASTRFHVTAYVYPRGSSSWGY